MTSLAVSSLLEDAAYDFGQKVDLCVRDGVEALLMIHNTRLFSQIYLFLCASFACTGKNP
jgi:hypothetical protein